MDVRPSNIVTSGTQVMLIGWGSAHEINANLTSFVGCRPYAHDELFGPLKSVKPCLSHDVASLAYTVVCLHEGSVPWSGFSSHSAVSVEARKRRLKLASKILTPLLEKLNVSLEIKQALLKAIGYEESKSTN